MPKPLLVNGEYTEDREQPLMTDREISVWLLNNSTKYWLDNTPRKASVGGQDFVYRGFR